MQGFRGVADERMNQCWLVNRLRDEHLELIRRDVLDKVAQELSGSTRSGSVFDPANRM